MVYWEDVVYESTFDWEGEVESEWFFVFSTWQWWDFFCWRRTCLRIVLELTSNNIEDNATCVKGSTTFLCFINSSLVLFELAISKHPFCVAWILARLLSQLVYKMSNKVQRSKMFWMRLSVIPWCTILASVISKKRTNACFTPVSAARSPDKLLRPVPHQLLPPSRLYVESCRGSLFQ